MDGRRDLGPEEDLSSILATHERVLVTFYADWCAPCAVLDTFVEEVLPELDAPVVRVDVEAHPALADAHEVTQNPTLIGFEDGDVVLRRAGLPDRQAFRELVAPWLA